MIERAQVIGAGRVGSALAARLRERGLELDGSEPQLVLLCVPDRAIAEVARGVAPGPWVAHVSGATSLEALDPHARRFSMHPLQTFTLDRGPEQLDGAYAAVSAETDEAREVGLWLARTLGLRAVRASRHQACGLPRGRRGRLQLPRHAAAGRRLAARGGGSAARGTRPAHAPDDRERLRADGADRARRLGDRRRAHRGDPRRAAAARAHVRHPRRDDEGVPVRTIRAIDAIRDELARRPGSVGLVPTMGSLHAGHLALFAAAREECDTVVASVFVNAAQFDDAVDLAAYPRDEGRDEALAEEAGVDLLFAPPTEEIYPAGFQTWVDVEELARDPRGRAPAGPLPRRRDRLPQAVQHRPAGPRLLRAEGRAAGRGDPPHGARPRPRLDG